MRTSFATAPEPRAIAEAMGGERVLKRRVRSDFDLHSVIVEGLPKGAAEHVWQVYFKQRLAKRLFGELIASPATMKRAGALSVPAGERVERVARLTTMAERTFGDRDRGVQWLTTAHPMLGQHTPLDLARTETGGRQVERLLNNILHDLPA